MLAELRFREMRKLRKIEIEGVRKGGLKENYGE